MQVHSPPHSQGGPRRYPRCPASARSMPLGRLPRLFRCALRRAAWARRSSARKLGPGAHGLALCPAYARSPHV